MLKVVAIFQTEFQTKAKARSVLRASIINFQFTAQLKIRLRKHTCKHAKNTGYHENQLILDDKEYL